MNLDEKVGMMLINSLLMAKAHPEHKSDGVIITEDTPKQEGNPFGGIPATDNLIQKRHMRHFIARDYKPTADMLE